MKKIDNFTVIYKILSTLEQAMDSATFNADMISAEVLGISQYRWIKYIQMLQESGYITGVSITSYMNGEAVVDMESIRITLKGLEYLQENSIMQRIYRTLKGIHDLKP